MRKLFWSCAAVAVAAAGTVYLAAKHVEQHPYAVVGQAMAALCGVQNAQGSPGLGAPAESVIPADPAPVAEPLPLAPSASATTEPAGQVVAFADGPLPGHIDVSTQPMPGCKESCVLGACDPDMAPAEPVTETVTAVKEAYPAVMPYCKDDSDGTPRQMPYAEEEACEEEQGACVFDLLMKLMSIRADVADEPMGAATPETPVEQSVVEQPQVPAGECKEDPHHDYHYPSCPHTVCPYTGRSYYQCPTPSPAVPDVPAPAGTESQECPKPDCEKKNAMPEKGASLDASFKGLSEAFSALLEEEQENAAAAPRVDTMECRPSDLGLKAFIPGPL